MMHVDTTKDTASPPLSKQHEVDTLLEEAWEMRDSPDVEAFHQLIAIIQTQSETKAYDLGNAACLVLRGTKLHKQHNLQEAFKTYQQARLLMETSEASLWKCRLYMGLSIVYRELNQLDLAIDCAKNTLEMAKEINDITNVAASSQLIGILYSKLGNYEQKIEYMEQAAKLFEETHEQWGLLTALLNLSIAYRMLGDYHKCEPYIQHAMQLSTSLKHLRGICLTHRELGYLRLAQENYSEARENLLAGLEPAQQLDYGRVIIEIHLSLAQIPHPKDQQKHHTAEAIRIATEIEDKQSLAEALKNAAELAKQEGNLKTALETLEQYLSLKEELAEEAQELALNNALVVFETEKAQQSAREYQSQKLVAEKIATEAERLVKLRTQELENSRIEIVMRLAQAAEHRDADTGEHTFRVGRNAAAIAYHLGWDIEDIKILYLASRLHDVGKIGISDSILLKPGKFTDEEFEMMRQHTVIGAKILSRGESALLQTAEQIALSHHERWDGHGYPNKLSGNQIPMAARIVSIADVLDALTHARPYKKAWSVENTLTEIKNNSGTQFDPAVVDVAMDVFDPTSGISPINAPSDWDTMLYEFQSHFEKQREIAINSKVLPTQNLAYSQTSLTQ